MADNLLDKASILLTPTAYDNGSMLSIKPESGNGDEKVVNGDFATNLNNWETSSWWVWNVLGAYHPPTNLHKPLYQETCVIGKRYLITFDLNVVQGAAKVSLGNNIGGTTQVFATNLGTGSYKYYVTASDEYLIFNRSITSSNNEYYLKNVSVVEDLSGDFDFQRNSAATRVNAQGLVENVQIISSELVSNGNFSEIGAEEVLNGNFSQIGSELVVNGGFDTGSNWTINGGNAEILNGKLNFNNAANYGTSVNNSAIVVSGKTYLVEYTISDYVSGSSQIRLGGQFGTSRNANGTYTEYIVSDGTAIRLYPSSNNTTLSIDNVSVKEVGQNWNLGTGWSIANGVATSNGVSFPYIKQTNVLVSGKTYLLTFDITSYTSGSIKYSDSVETPIFYSGVGSYSQTFTADSNNCRFQSASFSGSITNISVKEVGQDWTLGTGWSIDQANSKAVSDTTASNLTSSTTLISGRKYKFTISASKLSSGTFAFLLRFNTTNTNIGVVDADGDFTFITTADSTSFRLQNLSGGTTDFSVTNISVKEITDDTNIPRINYEGFDYQDSLGSELVTNGDFATDSDWNSNDASITISGGLLNFDNTPLNRFVYQGNTEVGKTYQVTYEIVSITSGAIRMNCGNIGGIERTAPGVYTEQFTSISITGWYVVSRLANTVAQIDNVSVKEYLGQEVVPDSGCGSWLLEPQSTNLMVTSEPIGTGSFNTGVVFQQTGIFDWNGIYYGDNSVRRIAFFTPITITPNVDFCISLFVKMTDGSVPNYSNSFQSSETDFTFNFAGTPQVGTPILISNGIYRINIVGQTSSSSFNFLVEKTVSMSSKSFEISGFQCEALSFPTSYIPTNGATNTRLQDIANNSGNSSLINSTEGVLYAEIAALANDGTFRIISLTENANIANRTNIFYTNSSNKVRISVRVSNSTTFDYQTTLTNALDYNKIALRYKENDFAVYVNGVKEATQLSGSTYPANTLDTINFKQGSTLPFYGNVKALVVYKEALTDAELQALTTI